MEMLYSIIPPVLVVLSLVGIIVFLMKKAPDVARVSEEKQRTRLLNQNGAADGALASFSSDPASARKDFRHWFLVVLEKVTRKFRVLFLKLENKLTSWSEAIREKRRGRPENRESGFPVGSSDQDDIINRVRNYEAGKVSTDQIGTQIGRRPMRTKVEESPARVDFDQQPEKKVETKDRLEKILIERIATNPKDTEAYERLGEYYFEISNWEHSKECFKQVIKLDPRNSVVKQRMRKLERLLSK